jgi:flagellar protein FlgJ
MNSSTIDIGSYQAQQSYTDLNQLNDIRILGHDSKEQALRKVAQQFESLFMQMMLKSMRASNEVFAKDNPLNSFEMGFHKDMLDNQLSLSLSQGNQLGLAEAFYRKMQQTYLSSPSVGIEGKLTDPKQRISVDPYGLPTDKIMQRKQDALALDDIKTPDDFIAAVSPYAKKIAETMGLDYQVLIAQAALETGWGEHSIRDTHGNHSFNLFNIKADDRWQGHSVTVPTMEYHNGVAQKESAKFRRYDTIADAFDDYQQFLTQPRYEKALTVASDGQAFMAELQEAGYATDPHYAAKINRIVDSYFQK